MSLLRDLVVGVAASLLGAGIITLLGYFFSDFVRRKIQKWFHFLFDTKVQMQLSSVDRYDREPSQGLDMSVFRRIQSEIEPVEFDSLNDGILRVRGDSLPTPLEIRLEAKPTPGSDISSERYELVTKTYTDMTFGYRSDKPITEFQSLNSEISSVVRDECFDGRAPTQSFVTGTIKGKLPLESDKIEDEEIGMTAESDDGEVSLVFRDPHHLRQGIRKYFQPI